MMNRLEMLEKKQKTCREYRKHAHEVLLRGKRTMDGPTYTVWDYLWQIYQSASLNIAVKIDSEHLHHI